MCPEILHTTDLTNKLELVPTRKEALSILGFGDTSSNMRELPTATVYLQTETETIPMNVLIVQDIAVPLRTYSNNMEYMKHLTSLKLAHPAMNDRYFEISRLLLEHRPRQGHQRKWPKCCRVKNRVLTFQAFNWMQQESAAYFDDEHNDVTLCRRSPPQKILEG